MRWTFELIDPAMPESTRSVTGFRARLFLVIVLTVSGVTLLAAFITHRHLRRVSEEAFLESIEQQAQAAEHTRNVRQTVLSGICSDLARQPRIHAALEDDALDLLYPSAANELRQLTRERSREAGMDNAASIRARFYRFLDTDGHVIELLPGGTHGALAREIERALSLGSLPESQQLGYIHLPNEPEMVELITLPIISLESLRPIAALVVGFPLDLLGDLPPEENLASGFWIDGHAYAASFESDRLMLLESAINDLVQPRPPDEPIVLTLDGDRYRILFQALNPGSAYPVVYGFFISSMAPFEAQQARLGRGIFFAASLVLILGLITAQFVAHRMAGPVEALALVTEAEHSQRIHAEEALDSATQELERAARFSADASHQLKTPVAVMRAGLEELLVDPTLPEPLGIEVRALIQQTGRLTRVIEDLLLLSRLDAGCLEIELHPIELHRIIEGLVDDFSILPESDQVKLEVAMPQPLCVMGNRGYTTLILQNLLENARKYNRPGGRISIRTGMSGGRVLCRIGNTGKGIHPEVQPRIFERFHRGSSGENVPGYGLGLNLSLELARLHGGDLQLVVSREDWTEFQLVLRGSDSPAIEPPSSV